MLKKITEKFDFSINLAPFIDIGTATSNKNEIDNVLCPTSDVEIIDPTSFVNTATSISEFPTEKVTNMLYN